MTAKASIEYNVRSQVSPEEWEIRVKLAACYRLIAHFGWDDLIFTHISAKVPGSEHFLINPYGKMFHEITASSLVKVDLNGNKVLPFADDINPAGYTIHSAIHEVRSDVYCVLHTHTPAGIAVSAQKQGLLPISQQSLFVLASLAYHAYEGVALDHDEKARLQKDLGSATFLILPNHGLLTAAATVEDAFLGMYTLQRACEIQVLAQAGGGELTYVPQAVLDGAKQMVEGVLKANASTGAGLAWSPLIRLLDQHNPGYEL